MSSSLDTLEGSASMRIYRLIIVFAATAAFAQSAGTMHKALGAEAKRLERWASDGALISAAKAQTSMKMPLAEIMKIDEEWQAGRVRKETTTGACADRLRALVRERDYYVEAFVTDNQGALVCANAVTSDYYQGDEAKWSRAYDDGRGAVFVDRPRFDESAKATLGFISLPMRDGTTVIGVVTVGLVAEKLPTN